MRYLLRAPFATIVDARTELRALALRGIEKSRTVPQASAATKTIPRSAAPLYGLDLLPTFDRKRRRSGKVEGDETGQTSH